jgi:thymidylate kinase
LESKLIVIDGPDGSGKTEQTTRLIKRLEDVGYSVKTVSFPRYGATAAADVEKYLNGLLGPKESIEPRKVAGFYAFDRADFAPVMRAEGGAYHRLKQVYHFQCGAPEHTVPDLGGEGRVCGVALQL